MQSYKIFSDYTNFECLIVSEEIVNVRKNSYFCQKLYRTYSDEYHSDS